jgi:hypothetical protein
MSQRRARYADRRLRRGGRHVGSVFCRLSFIAAALEADSVPSTGRKPAHTGSCGRWVSGHKTEQQRLPFCRNVRNYGTEAKSNPYKALAVGLPAAKPVRALTPIPSHLPKAQHQARSCCHVLVIMKIGAKGREGICNHAPNILGVPLNLTSARGARMFSDKVGVYSHMILVLLGSPIIVNLDQPRVVYHPAAGQ